MMGGGEGVAVGSALETAFDGMREIGGRMVVVQTLSATMGLGVLPNRDNHRNYGTDTEPAMYIPDADKKGGGLFYQELAKKCVASQVSVDLFVCSKGAADLASLSVLPTLTGGQLSYMPEFDPADPNDTAKLRDGVVRTVSRNIAWEAVMKVRCSRGLNVASFIGHGVERDGAEVDLPTADGDKATLCLLEHDGSIPEENDEVYIQCAVLYTASDGRRLIRVLNAGLPVLKSLQKVFRASDLEALTNALARTSARDLVGWPTVGLKMAKPKPLAKVRQEIIQRCADILFVYRQHCASNSSPGQVRKGRNEGMKDRNAMCGCVYACVRACVRAIRDCNKCLLTI